MATTSAMGTAIAEARRGFESLKDALRVEWDTLTRVKFNTGQLIGDDGKLKFGEWIDFELLSFQDNWQISPGADTKEASELARYSDDGVYIKGTAQTCVDYIKELNGLGYTNARLSKRLVLVLSVLDCEKDVDMEEGKLCQIDAPPTTLTRFEQYKNQCALDMAKGRADFAACIRIRATTGTEHQKRANKDYVALTFTRMPAAA